MQCFRFLFNERVAVTLTARDRRCQPLDKPNPSPDHFLKVKRGGMVNRSDEAIRVELVDRRTRLEAAVAQTPDSIHFGNLLREVDAALERLQQGSYGLCEACHDPIEEDRLTANPLLRYCLPHLTSEEQHALEEDLDLAFRIQNELLPQRHQLVGCWEVCYQYEAAGPVSGDYCDLIQIDDGTLLFILGDVSGKGVAASMLMSHLHATFRTLTTLGLPVDQLMERANRISCDAMIPGHFATIVCGIADRTGSVQLVNAGHCPPLVVRAERITPLEATGLPLGLFCNTEYGVTSIKLAHGESLLLYTDGLSEARSPSNAEYGSGRLGQLAAERHALSSQALVSACLEDLAAFQSGMVRGDDLTVMVIQRAC
jgi:sigma-B regulation protein RsbU (phosphoserine phosphatase)